MCIRDRPKIYDGEGAVKDTAYEVRRARNQGIFVIGIFVGNEGELSVEKRIYGKDFGDEPEGDRHVHPARHDGQRSLGH